MKGKKKNWYGVLYDDGLLLIIGRGKGGEGGITRSAKLVYEQTDRSFLLLCSAMLHWFMSGE